MKLSRTLSSAIVASALLCAIPLIARADRPTLANVSQGLTCQCGCGLTVANCNHPTCSFSVPIREQIESMIGQGKSGPEIIAFYRHQYGEKVLSAPTTEGFNVMAWLMPFIALAFGGALIVLTASRWRSVRPSVQPDSASRAEPRAASFDPNLVGRLNAELRENR